MLYRNKSAELNASDLIAECHREMTGKKMFSKRLVFESFRFELSMLSFDRIKRQVVGF